MQTTIFNWKRIILFAIFFLTFVLICNNYFLKKLSIPEIKNNSSAQSIEKLMPAAPQENQPITTKVDLSKPVTVDGKSYYLFTMDEMNDIKDWMKNKGYSQASSLVEYESYSENVLIELAKNGDLTALNILKNKAINSGNSKAGKRYLTLAALYGSTPALSQLSQLAEPVYSNDKTESQRRPHALEALAIKKIIELRGDHNLARLSRDIFEKDYKLRYKTDLILSPEEQKYVNNRAQSLYDQFQSIRQQKGLGDFDNTEPDAVKKYTGAN